MHWGDHSEYFMSCLREALADHQTFQIAKHFKYKLCLPLLDTKQNYKSAQVGICLCIWHWLVWHSRHVHCQRSITVGVDASSAFLSDFHVVLSSKFPHSCKTQWLCLAMSWCVYFFLLDIHKTTELTNVCQPEAKERCYLILTKDQCFPSLKFCSVVLVLTCCQLAVCLFQISLSLRHLWHVTPKLH